MAVSKDGKLIYTTAILCDKKDISPFVSLIDSKTGNPLSVPNEGVLVSENMVESFGYRVGDSIYLTDSFGRSCETVISGVFKRNVGYALVISSDVYKSVTGEIADLSQYYIKIYRVNRDKFISGMYEYPAFIGITSTIELSQRVTDMTNSLDKIVFIMAVYALLLAVFVIFNLAIMNINRKRNELAVMVSLGTPMKKVFLASVSDNLIVSFFALFIGSVFGYLGGSFIVSHMRFENFMLVRNTGIGVILFGVLICVVFVVMANVCSLVKVRKINITELTRGE